ncbi:MAG TPA: hypothetical protein VHV55_10670 [Pirellulales bacterium]|jgi:hypothetical protein|nr:hypothetical protein [Pirellulales bacterium]
MKPNQYRSLLLAMLLLCSGASCQRANDLTPVLRAADKIVLIEGLPHPLYERELLTAELHDKKTQEIHGYPFYQEPLAWKDDDAQRVSDILGHTALSPMTRVVDGHKIESTKTCGGFHPDYALQVHQGTTVFDILICFHCHEVMIVGPGVESTYDLPAGSADKLIDILKHYRSQRPKPELGDHRSGY